MGTVCITFVVLGVLISKTCLPQLDSIELRPFPKGTRRLTIPYNMLRVPKEYAGQIRDLLTKLKSADVGVEWLEALKLFLRKENPWPLLVTIFKGIDALITAGGYQKLDSWICDQNAPQYIHTGSDTVVEYLYLGALSSSEEGLDKMKAMGYRPAQDPEVLAQDMKHPDQLVERNPVVVLGSVWQNRNGNRNRADSQPQWCEPQGQPKLVEQQVNLELMWKGFEHPNLKKI